MRSLPGSPLPEEGRGRRRSLWWRVALGLCAVVVGLSVVLLGFGTGPHDAGAAAQGAVSALGGACDGAGLILHGRSQPVEILSERFYSAASSPGGRLDGALHVVIKVTRSSQASDLAMFGLTRGEAVGDEGIYVLDVAPGEESQVAKTLATVRNLPGVVWAQEAAVRSACIDPDDPFYAPSTGIGQWGMRQIGMPAAWELETGSADVVVALLDTGIDRDLPDFAGRIVSPYSAVDRRSEWPYWQDNNGHGTQVAGVAVAQGENGQGVAGVAWNVKIMPVKIADQTDTYDYTLADGIHWAVDHGADVVNISFAGDQVTAVESDAIAYAVEHGAIVVAAAGNSGAATVAYPAALPGVLAVGATSRVPANTRASFSSTGEDLDLVAPGTDIWTDTAGSSGFVSRSGTSFSAPLVTGVAALMLSMAPELSADEAESILAESADDLGEAGRDLEYGWGLLDAGEAVSMAGETAQTTTTTTGSTTTTLPATTTTTAPVAARFEDVSAETSPYFEQIEQLATLGIVSGTGDRLFHPQEDLRRQQFAKMILLTLGYRPQETDTCPFVDVMHMLGDLYPYHYVALAWHRGITNGTTSDHFSPYRSLTRAQLITMIARAAALPEPPSDYVAPFRNFSDVHFPFARRAAYAGLLDGLVGMGEDYEFLSPASRGEVCALLYELLDE